MSDSFTRHTSADDQQQQQQQTAAIVQWINLLSICPESLRRVAIQTEQSSSLSSVEVDEANQIVIKICQ